MDVRYTTIGYAYTPVLGEKPVFRADVQIDGKPYQFEVPANDTFETWQAVCQYLNIPFEMPI